MATISTSSFKRLIGTWKTTGKVLMDNQAWDLNGMDTYEWVLGDNYILHKADVTIGKEKSETYEMISLGESADQAKMQYFNSKGESGVMASRLSNNDFQIHGEGIKFEGEINDENTKVAGKWYLKSDKDDWSEFIELKLEKISVNSKP